MAGPDHAQGAPGRELRHHGTVTWTAPAAPPSPDGPFVGTDRPILEAFIAWQRSELLGACAGLTGDQLVIAAVPPSNLTLLGLVRHLAKVERIWFRERAAGQAIGRLFDPELGPDHDFEGLDPAEAEADFARYAQECRLGDEAVAGLPFDHELQVHGETWSLRMVYVHLVAEYSRHNGHADLLRERIDAGITG